MLYFYRNSDFSSQFKVLIVTDVLVGISVNQWFSFSVFLLCS